MELAWGKVQTEQLSKTDGIVLGVDYKVKIDRKPNWPKENRSGKDAKGVRIKVKRGSAHNKGNTVRSLKTLCFKVFGKDAENEFGVRFPL